MTRRLFSIPNFARIKKYGHIIWDIDRTITDEDGRLSQEVAAKICNVAKEDGVFHSFITGRDAAWICANVIVPLQQFYMFADVRNKLDFYGEVGSVIQHVDESGNVTKWFDADIEKHPLRTNQNGIRDKLRKLVYDPDQLSPFQEGMKLETTQEVYFDANGQGYVVNLDRQEVPLCHPYIWSTSKEAFATYEKIRSSDGRISDFDQTPFADKIREVIRQEGMQDQIDLEVIGTAINIVPKVNGGKLGKSWAAGKALLNLWDKKLGRRVPLDAVVAGTISAGDGLADLDFTVPVFPHTVEGELRTKPCLDIIFVGSRNDLPKPGHHSFELTKNIIIQATGEGTLAVHSNRQSITWHDAIGATVIAQVLDYMKLWTSFRSFL